MKNFVFIFAFGAFFFSGCTHGLKSLDSGLAKKLRLVPQVGAKDRTRYFSHSITETFQNGELAHKKREDVEFAVETAITNVDAVNNRIHLEMTTVEQDGSAELRDFAMPALNEKIKMVMDDRTQVYFAGKYAKDTIFYVPPLSLPERAVKPGDTWEMNVEWRTFEGIPLRMELVSVLKGFVECGKAQCADIEVSANVQILNSTSDMRFRSELSGRYLFSLDRGLTLWSLIRSDQEITTVTDRIAVTNCLLSRLEEPKEYLWEKVTAEDCSPSQTIPEKIADAISLIVPTL